MKRQGITLSELEELLPVVFFGAEGEGDDESGSDESDDDDAGSDDDNGSDNEHDDANDPKVKGLKSALAAERARADAAEKKLKAAQAKAAKDQSDRELADKSEVEQAQTREQNANGRAAKMAAGLLRRDLDDAIRAAAVKLNFIDPSDAISGVDRAKLTYTQDEDDPSIIDIDLKTVETEVKAIATKKPHFIQAGTDDGEPTGGQFGRGGKKKKQSSEDALKDKYPGLR